MSKSRAVPSAVRAALLALFLLAPGQLAAQPACVPTPTRLCLNGNRFQVEVAWRHPRIGSGAGRAVPFTADTGLFWFFQDSNLELVVKVLDGRLANRHFWVFYGGLSDVEYTITVADLQTGARQTYHNPRGTLASRAYTRAFGPELPPAAAPASQPPSPVSAPLPPSLLRQGPEVQVNVTTQGMQRAPDVAIGPGGNALVVWASDSQDVYGRLYDGAGNPRGGEIRLSSATPESRYGVRVAASPTGEFMAVWGNDSHVTARLFGGDGQPLGGEIPINSSPYPQLFSDVTTDPAGGFLVAWRDIGNPVFGVPGTVRAQRFDAHGERVGSEVEVDSGGGSEVRVAAFPSEASSSGGFLVTWIATAGSDEADVQARRLASSGQPLGPAFRANDQDGIRLPGNNTTAIAVFHPGGGFSVVWTTEVFPFHTGTPGLFARRYGPDGTPAAIVKLGGDASGSEGTYPAPAAASLPSGDTLLIWNEQNPPGDPGGGLLGRLFDPFWQPLGDALRVNAYTPDIQTEPAVAAAPSGGIVAVWGSGVEYPPFLPFPGDGEGTQDGHYFGVFGQRFKVTACIAGPDRLCLGGRFLVETRFTSPATGQPEAAHAVPLTGDTGSFWFFNESNGELVIKVLDGRAYNGHFWVFSAALSDVEYQITVTDTETGQSKTYHNAAHQLASRADTRAFP